MPLVAVLGATVDERPPGIDPAASLAELRYAGTAEEVAGAIAEADAVFSWGAPRAWLRDAFPTAAKLRWVQSAQRRGRRAAVPGARVERGRRHERAGCVRRPDRRMGDRRDGRVHDRLAGVDRRSDAPAVGPTGAVATRSPVATWSWSARVRSAAPLPSRARALGMTVEAVGRAARTDDAFGSVAGPDGLPRGARSRRPRARRAPADRGDDRDSSTRKPSPRCDRPRSSSTWAGAAPSTRGR